MSDKNLSNAEINKVLQKVLNDQAELKLELEKKDQKIADQAKQLESNSLDAMEAKVGQQTAADMYRNHNAAMKSDLDSKAEAVEEFFEHHHMAQNSGKHVYSIEYRVHVPDRSFAEGGSSEVDEKWFKAEFTHNHLVDAKEFGDDDFARQVGGLWYEACAFRGSKLVNGEELRGFGQPEYRNAKYKGKNKNSGKVKPFQIAVAGKDRLTEAFEEYDKYGDFGTKQTRTSRVIETV